jgi:WD40 repeat protein
LADRLVEVIAYLGESVEPKYRYGSGLIVRGRTVLTAAHVVAGAADVTVRDPGKREYPATVDPRFVGDPSGPGPDLALVEIEDETLDLPPLGLARVDRDASTADPVERCHAIGYPWFAEIPSPRAVRETVDAIGVVPVLSKLHDGLLSVLVTQSPRSPPPKDVSLGESEWSGMSGAAVVVAGLLLGVVIEHALREGPSAITAVPLTALERDPAHPEWGPGVTDPAAWWSRLGVAGVNDLKLLPARPERPEPDYLATLRTYGRTLHERMPQLLGRARELADIASFATGSAGYKWLVGGPYAGKTALLYEAVMAGLPVDVDADVDVVSYFLSRLRSDANSNRFLTAVVPQLAYLCDVDRPVRDRDEFNALWEQAAGRAAEFGRHLLLVVDGLDEDLLPPGTPSVASLLPSLVGEHAHVLVSSRPHSELPDDVLDHPLRETSRVELEPFVGAAELAELARREIDSLMRSDDSGLAVEVLGLLTAAGGPLSVRDLADLSNGGAGSATAHAFQVERLVTERAIRSLEPFGSEAPQRYQFAHPSFEEYASKNQYLIDPEFRSRIHRWAELWRDRDWPSGSDVNTYTPQYLLENYPATLTSDPDGLAALVSDAGWVDAAIQSVGVDNVMADLRNAVAAAPTSKEVGAMLRAVRGQAHNLSPSHPLDQPGYVSRQLCLQSAELSEDALAEQFRTRLRSHGSGLVPLWTTRPASRALLQELGRHESSVRSLAALPDGRVVSGGTDGRLLVWESGEGGSQPLKLGRHEGQVRAVAALPDGRVVSGGTDGRVLRWDAGQARSQPGELGRHEDWVRGVAALPDGRVVSGGADGRVLLWETKAGSQPRELGRHEGPVRALAALPDGRVVSGGGEGRVLLWKADEAGSQPCELGRHGDWVQVRAVAALPDGRVVSGGTDGRLLVWEADEAGSQPRELGRHEGPVGAVAVLPDGRLVSGGGDGRVLLWEAGEAGSQARELGRHDDWVRAVAVLPDGRVVSGGDDRRVLLWEAGEADSQSRELGHDEGRVWAAAVLADGRVVSGAADGRLLLWEAGEAGSQPRELGRHEGSVRAVAALPDGRVVSGADDGRLLLWEAGEAGSRPLEIGRHGDWVKVRAVAALPDGRVVSGGSEGRVLLWETGEAGSQARELGRHDGTVRAVAALPEGRVVSGGNDGRVRLWDATTQSEIAQLSCSFRALGAEHSGRNAVSLVIAHAEGLSFWSVAGIQLQQDGT